MEQYGSTAFSINKYWTLMIRLFSRDLLALKFQLHSIGLEDFNPRNEWFYVKVI